MSDIPSIQLSLISLEHNFLYIPKKEPLTDKQKAAFDEHSRNMFKKMMEIQEAYRYYNRLETPYEYSPPECNPLPFIPVTKPDIDWFAQFEYPLTEYVIQEVDQPEDNFPEYYDNSYQNYEFVSTTSGFGSSCDSLSPASLIDNPFFDPATACNIWSTSIETNLVENPFFDPEHSITTLSESCSSQLICNPFFDPNAALEVPAQK